MADNDSIADLVRVALDEFEDRPLEVSARRAYRIARLNGDSREAHRLHLDLRPLGGAAVDTQSAARNMYSEFKGDDRDAVIARSFEDWTPARPEIEVTGPNVHSGSIVELALTLQFTERVISASEEAGLYNDDFQRALQTKVDRTQVLERIRSWTFDYLVRVESQLGLSDPVSRSFESLRQQVDALLARVGSDVPDQVAAAIRAAETGGAEGRAHVPLTCRRLLKAVADALFPPSDEPRIGGDGKPHDVGSDHVTNRLIAHVEDHADARATGAAITELSTRIETLARLQGKGVHADVSNSEMQFALAQTYLLAGETIQLSVPSTDEGDVPGATTT